MSDPIAVPPVTISDVESLELSLSAKLPDGSDDPGPFAWATSDEALGKIVGDQVNDAGEHVPDPANTSPTGNRAWLLTPGGPGSVVVTASSASANVNANTLEVTLTEGREGSVNLSPGRAVSDQ